MGKAHGFVKRMSVKGVKVMPDFSSTCLWELKRGGMVYPREIGLSCNIVNALDAFERYYDDVATGRPGYFVRKRHEVKLNTMGRKIAEDIKAERPELNVWYWGEYSKGELRKERIKRARSSVGTEHPAYTRKVGGSNPLAPTKLKRRKS